MHFLKSKTSEPNIGIQMLPCAILFYYLLNLSVKLEQKRAISTILN